jgi:tetratricopeptide (TPR) repeat protein
MKLTVLVLIAWLALVGRDARGDAPWAVGVTEEQKAQAKAALDEGNVLLLNKQYAEALAKYQTALASWEHPAIRFNVVRCLIQLDRLVEASDNLKLALQYGAAPLDEAIYNEALAYERLLANQIGELVVACDQGGVKLTLDGQPLAHCPAKTSRRVVPGPHQLVAIKQGFLTRTVDVVVVGGKKQAVSVKLEPLGKNVQVVHRWSAWVPWTVFAAGFGIAGAGALLQLDATSDMDNYDRILGDQCKVIPCTDSQLAPYDSLRSSAELQSRVAGGVMIAGATTVVVGAAMLYLNRGRAVRLDAVPSSDRSGATLLLRGQF